MSEFDPQVSRRLGQPAIRLPVVLAGLVIVAGFGALVLTWYRVGNTDQVWIQNQDIVSGGLGGLALVVFGSALLIRDALLRGGRVLVGGNRYEGSSIVAEPDAAAAAGPSGTAATEASSVGVEANGEKMIRRRPPGGRRTR